MQVQVGGRGKGGGVVARRLAGAGGRGGRPDARERLQGARGHAGPGRGAPADRARVLHVDPARPLDRRVPRDDDRRGRAWTSRRSRWNGPRRSRRVALDPALGSASRGTCASWSATLAAPTRARAPATSCARSGTCSAPDDLTLVEVNPLVQLEDGAVVALDAKVTIDDNALFRHPDLEALSAAVPDRPRRGARHGGRPPVREARRRGRDHRQRRRSRHVDARRRRPGGRACGELPRRRGWRERGEDGDLAAGRPVRPRRAVRVHQHLRRDHAVRRGRDRHPRGARAGRGDRPARRPARRDERRRGAADPRGGRASADRAPSPRWTTRPPRPHGSRERPRERPRRRRHAAPRPGDHRERRARSTRCGTARTARRSSRASRPAKRDRTSRASPCSTPSPTPSARRARTRR